MILTLPLFTWTWLWDDFDFLGRVQVFRPAMLLPDPGSVFYRPISREIYFGLVWLIGRGSPFAGHVLNALILAAAIALVVSIGTRLAGRRVGLSAGFAFAFLGATPLLVGWVSGVQDLLALLFVLAAVRLQLEARSWQAALALLAAVLSKEVALAALPVLAALPLLVRPSRGKPATQWAPYVAVTAVWALVHPGIRILAGRGFQAGEAGYLGMGVPHRVEFLAGTLLTFVNAPFAGAGAPWPPGLTPWLVLAALMAILGFGLGGTGRRRERTPGGPPSARGIILVGALLALGPTLLLTQLLRSWAPYYSAVPAAGISLLFGLALARLPTLAALPLLLAYGVLGIWSRGFSPGPSVPCEANLVRQSVALEEVRSAFMDLHPHLPRGSVAMVSVGSTGTLGVHTHMHRLQALRIWYRDPSIRTFTPEQCPSDSTREFLFRVTPDLSVVEIDAERGLTRYSGHAPLQSEVSRPARTYARALAAAGELDRAVRIQAQLARWDRGAMRLYDLRLAGMYLLAAGRSKEADALLDSVPPPPRSMAVEFIKKLYEDPTPGVSVEQFGFPAFGIQARDLEANREIMKRLLQEGYLRMAGRVARRVLEMAPADSEAAAVIGELARTGGTDRVTSPVAPDSL